ncbi:MAG: GGDEF domain-containing protein [Actinobacteria bacterium]|nr:GGDEF domain-containing protein [Actinomycetota bacterium]
MSPLTGLPGNISIEQEIARRHAAGVPVALLYADINDFKAYNDHYGFLRGDDVIRTLAQVLRQVTSELAEPETFVGHIGGDDFVVLTAPERATAVAEAVAAAFDAAVPALYDPADVAAGAIEVADRRGDTHRFPLVTLSVGIATTALRQFEDHRELVAVASEMKQHAKQARGDGSNAAVDRRGSGDGAAALDGLEAAT